MQSGKFVTGACRRRVVGFFDSFLQRSSCHAPLCNAAPETGFDVEAETSMRLFTLALSALTLLAAPAQAQERAWTMHVAGGLTLPTGAMNTDFNTGWHVLAGGWWTSATEPWGVRVDAAYNNFTLAETRELEFGGGGQRTAFSLTGNLTYRIRVDNPSVTPYVALGMGGYWTSCSNSVCGSSTDLGWNAGGGARVTVLGLASFLEMRYHSIGSQGRYFPLTFGVTF
jgi:hypothetical protein